MWKFCEGVWRVGWQGVCGKHWDCWQACAAYGCMPAHSKCPGEYFQLRLCKFPARGTAAPSTHARDLAFILSPKGLT